MLPTRPAWHDNDARIEEVLPLKVTRCAFAHYADDVDIETGPAETCRLTYEDNGLGCLEMTLDFVPKHGRSLLPLLVDNAAWSKWSDDLIAVIDGRQLAVQAAWPGLRDALVQTIGPADRLAGFEDLRPNVSNEALDNTCDTYGNCLIVRHTSASEELVLRNLGQISRAVGSYTPRAFGSANRESSSVLRENGVTALFFHYYGVVAAMPHDAPEDPRSDRVLAMTRYLWMSYASLMVAADGLQARIGTAVAAYGGAQDELSLREEIEKLTRLTGVLAIMRYDALPENFTADEFEAGIYGGGFAYWNMATDVSLLDRSIEDATRVVGGLSHLAAQKTEKFVGAILAFIAGLTLVSVLQDASQLLQSNPIRPGSQKENSVIVAAVFLATVVLIGLRLGAFRALRRFKR